MTATDTNSYPVTSGIRGHVESLSQGEIDTLRERTDFTRTVSWTDPTLVRVLRLRLIGAAREYPFWDISYCTGQLADGSVVPVALDVELHGRLGRFSWKRDLVAEAIRAGVNAKRLGLLDENVVSRLPG